MFLIIYLLVRELCVTVREIKLKNNCLVVTEKTSSVTKHILCELKEKQNKFKNIVWTFNMRQSAVLIKKAQEFKEPVLLVGETGGGKTTICQILAGLNSQELVTVNCHMHTESGDFIGGLHPVRDHSVRFFRFLIVLLY